MKAQVSDNMARFDGEGKSINPPPFEVLLTASTPPDAMTFGETPKHIQEAFAGDPQANFVHVGPPFNYQEHLASIITSQQNGVINIPVLIPGDETSSSNDPDPGKHVFKSGAARSKVMSWLTMIPLFFLKRVAAVFEYGAKKYGLQNWKKGDQDFVDDIPNHIVNHLYLYLQGDRSEDHLANMTCNIIFLMWMETTKNLVPKKHQEMDCV